jgi:hypothetical protein
MHVLTHWCLFDHGAGAARAHEMRKQVMQHHLPWLMAAG